MIAGLGDHEKEHVIRVLQETHIIEELQTEEDNAGFSGPRQMKNTSLSTHTSRIDTPTNPTISAYKLVSSNVPIEVLTDEIFIRTLNPCQNDCVLHHIDDVDTSTYKLPHQDLPYKETGPTRTLCHLRQFYTNTLAVTDILQNWMPKPRWKEINDHLIQALSFLDKDLALNVLLQLKKPKHVISKLDSNSVLIPMKITLPNGDDSVVWTPENLLDCGATNQYVHENYVRKNGWKIDPLPHPIPVYNADGSINQSGTIKATIELNIQIKDHFEQRQFAVTNIGDSDMILGFSWLKFHNPLVEWQTGDLCFSRCPVSCNITPELNSPSPIPTTLHGPDHDHI
jgi:hypothetical protein